MTSDTIKLSILSHPRYLQIVRGVMDKVTQIIGFSEDDAGLVILAVDEACSNIIKYSYMNNPRGKIDICVEIHPKKLKVVIKDYGKQCDVNQMNAKKTDGLKPGGLGLYIMNQVMDFVEYDCTSTAQNVVRMVKHFEAVRRG